jgi:DNA repair protein RadC
MDDFRRRRGKPLGIALHDHIIVGKEGHASFKGVRPI